ncbi:MAG: aldo/keto reductase [Actinobacteria bacterium]|uniref:Unannotated protein n=1 Tax=freshwater metagenome TaxID=449393 RepID=A0A6J7PPZ8_9ZZZZ|nr:aldo/keto reductase [Actinomycetota bacterium]
MDLPLNDGGSIPAIGFGTWPMDDSEAELAVAEAIAHGYRLIDTAFNYSNETGVGRAIVSSGIAREDLFLTSKFNREFHSVQGVAEAFEGSAKRLGVEYLDLFLIHWPNPDHDQYVQAWEGLIALREQGKVRHIGTSNFLPEHHARIIEATGVVPAVDQLQVNPRLSQPDARADNAARGIVTQAWSPLGQGNDLLTHPLLTELAQIYSATPAQVVIAWDLALGLATCPKTSTPRRMDENLAAASLVLRDADVEALTALDGSEEHTHHPNVFGH